MAHSRHAFLGRQHPDHHGADPHGQSLLDRLVSRAARAQLDRRRDDAPDHPVLLTDRLPSALGHQGVLRHRGHHQDRRLGAAGTAGHLHQRNSSRWPGRWTIDPSALLRHSCVPAARPDSASDVHPLPIHPRAWNLGADVMDEKLKMEGPGAAVAETEVPVVEGESHGHTLEPDYKRLPIGPDHILYPILVTLALFPILMGDAGHHLADDMPDDETHPFFPDHFWPYPIIIVAIMVAVALLTIWALAGPTFCLPWFINNPVCGA